MREMSREVAIPVGGMTLQSLGGLSNVAPLRSINCSAARSVEMVPTRICPSGIAQGVC